MKISDLRSEIEFQIQVETDSTYTVDRTWKTIIKTRGKIENQGGVTFDIGQNAEPLSTHTITIRDRSDIKRGMRIVSNNASYKINKFLIEEHDKRKYMVLHVEENETVI